MLGLTSVGVYIPGALDNIENGKRFEREEAFVLDKIGFSRLARIDGAMDTSDMCVKAFTNMVDTSEIDISSIDCMAVCTQNPDGFGLPHVSSIVHGKLNLPVDIAAFDISLGCSGYVYSLNIITAFMQANGFKCGLLFTADPYSKVMDDEDYVTNLVFGDAATCTLITETPLYTLGKSVYSTDGTKCGAIQVSDGRKVHMNGRDVFNFTMLSVPRQIDRCLIMNGLEKDDVDMFVMHQASRYIVENMRKRLNVEPERMPFLATEVGNTVSSTIPLVLQVLLRADSRPNTMVISGYGVGLSWATSVLNKA